jgi:hypothetical protein
VHVTVPFAASKASSTAMADKAVLTPCGTAAPDAARIGCARHEIFPPMRAVAPEP